MRYSKINKLDIVNGEGIGISLFVQGCHFHCKNCFNKETWDFNGGKKWTLDIEHKFIDLIDNPHIKRISILGGEPMDNENAFSIYCLITKIRNKFGNNKKIWVYTGYKFEDLYINRIENDHENAYKSTPQDNILYKIDILVDGQFMDDKKDITLPFRGSSNQRIIDVQKSIDANKVVLYKFQ